MTHDSHASLKARVEELEGALRDLLALPMAVSELRTLDLGIGTKMKMAAWLRARSVLQSKGAA